MLAAFVAACGEAEQPRTSPRLSEEIGIAAGGTIELSRRGELERELDGYVDLGVGWIRFDLRWYLVERRPGRLEWAKQDRVVKEARRRGLRILATVAYAPDWAKPDGTDSSIDPRAYARFAAAAVRRYSPQGVRAYEIWNEPNSGSFWEPEPDAEAYARLLRTASPAMKQVDPEITIVSGGLAPGCTGGRKISPVEFLADLYAAEAGEAFDAVGHHPYSAPYLPGDVAECSGWYQTAGSTQSVRSVMEDAGDGGKDVWATEFGAPLDAVGEDGQADQVSAGVARWRTEPWAGPLFVYAYRDRGNETWNLVRENWSRRPAWFALRDAVTALRGRGSTSSTGTSEAP